MNNMPLTNLFPSLQHPMERLQKMRESHSEHPEVPIRFDNFLAGHIQGNICFRRIKYACLLGRYYWIRNRYETTEEHHYNVQNNMTDSKFTCYDPHDDGKTMKLIDIDGRLATQTDFADIGVGLGLELECLESFLVASAKGETQSKYRLRQPARKPKKKVELSVVEVQVPVAPVLETGIPRQRKKGKGTAEFAAKATVETMEQVAEPVKLKRKSTKVAAKAVEQPTVGRAAKTTTEAVAEKPKRASRAKK